METGWFCHLLQHIMALRELDSSCGIVPYSTCLTLPSEIAKGTVSAYHWLVAVLFGAFVRSIKGAI